MHNREEVHFFMLQIKIVNGVGYGEIEDKINEFLATVDDDAVKDIKFDATEGIATIQYAIKEAWKDMMCCDCAYWDDGGEPVTSGLCQECGSRRRFNCKACSHFKDVRGCR